MSIDLEQPRSEEWSGFIPLVEHQDTLRLVCGCCGKSFTWPVLTVRRIVRCPCCVHRLHVPGTIHHHCAGCGQAIRADVELAGAVGRCRTCQLTQSLPAVQAQPVATQRRGHHHVPRRSSGLAIPVLVMLVVMSMLVAASLLDSP